MTKHGEDDILYESGGLGLDRSMDKWIMMQIEINREVQLLVML